VVPRWSWATLKDTIEGWILLSLKRSLPIPKLGDLEIPEIDVQAA
jgi:hypothetical protein